MLIGFGENLHWRFQDFTIFLIFVVLLLMHFNVELLTRSEHAFVALKSVKFVSLCDVIAQFFGFLEVLEAVRAEMSDVIVFVDMLAEFFETCCVEAASVLHALVGREEAIFGEENLMAGFGFGDV